MNCRHCGSELSIQLADLGSAPPSNAYLTNEALNFPETWLPLRVLVCEKCWLVQTDDYAQAESLFNADYAYFSSTSQDWLTHAAQYTAEIIPQLRLSQQSFVIEIACNDGYLLKNFVSAGIPCLGIEPTKGTAVAAERIGIPVLQDFFNDSLGQQLASQGKKADLVVGNNVYAHVPDINDFTRGLKTILKHDGTVTLEFPHFMRLLEDCQFDTIYHEHFSYFSLNAVNRIFMSSGLRLYDVQQISTHGGSLRIFGCHEGDTRTQSMAVEKLLAQELASGLEDIDTYLSFEKRVNRIKDDLLFFLLEQKRLGKKVAAYGAAAKGNTLLNYAGVRYDLLPFVCDAAASKQGKYLPGSRIPIVSPKILKKNRPDYLIILPWNISQEIIRLNNDLAIQGTQFVVAIPQLKII